MLDIGQAYRLVALFLAGAAWLNLRERRWSHAAFWGVLAALFVGGDAVLAASKAHREWPAQLAGIGVLALAGLAPRMHRGELRERDARQREVDALRLRHKLLLPAVLIPLVTLLVALFGARITLGSRHLFDASQMTLTGLALACVIALVAAFAATGVGDAIADLLKTAIPVQSALACILAYGLGMVLFTVIMGNAFAAFPVLTAGIGLPLLIHLHGANPAILGALGMLTGYCGTLFTPMAANFNIVPVALLELPNQNDVIRA